MIWIDSCVVMLLMCPLMYALQGGLPAWASIMAAKVSINSLSGLTPLLHASMDACHSARQDCRD